MNWLKNPQNILGLCLIIFSSVIMIAFGHEVFGVLNVTERLVIPIAALPLAFGLLILKTDFFANVAALRGDTSPTNSQPPSGEVK